MNEAQQMNFGKTPLGSFELATGSVSSLSGEGLQWCGHSVVWSSGFGPLAALCHCICFKTGLRQAFRCTLLRSSETGDP